MTFEQFRDACFKAALDNGCEAAEVFCGTADSFSVNILSGDIDRYVSAKDNGINLRVIFNGKNGYAYTEILEDPEALVARAMDNAASIENTDVNPMQGPCEYETITEPDNPLTEMTESEKIALAMKMEKDTLDFDGRVNRLSACTLSTGITTTHIHNTLGLRADSAEKFSYGVIGAILRQGDEEHDGYSVKMGAELTDYASMIKESVDNALIKFNASSVDSGEYRVLIRNDAAADLLGAFSDIFSADNVQKGLSLLRGKIGETVASEHVTLLDDPFEKGAPRAFDAEGVPSVLTAVIEKGVLKSFLHNLKTAHKDGVSSTSNAGRAGVSAPVGISPSNLYIAAGDKGYDELVSELGNGMIITELGGLHAGLNQVSGDFSLIASGLLVENGAVVRSVDQITCAGNFLTLMKDILAVGSDLKFGLPGASARIGCPSLLVGRMMISGK